MKILSKISSPKDLRNLSPELLPKLAREVREEIINTISEKGGHLGSSLGATDLIIALHYVFNTPEDKLVFDTGHQTYAHKLLTGRYKKFSTIRQKGGLSGFLKRNESEYDVFGAGHASTALSAALGLAAGRDINEKNNKVVAIVSDGCMTGGMSYEALQNAGQLGKNMLVVLNDNQMFISTRVGALGVFLAKLMSIGTVQNAEKKIETFLKRFKFWGSSIIRVAKRAKVLLFPGMLFEEMGFTYFGPIDGHDIAKMIDVLRHIKEIQGPVVLHVATKKGKGYPPAEEKPIAFHGLGIFDKSTGMPEGKTKDSKISYTKVFSNTLLKLAQEDSKIVAITAAMPEGTGLDAFRDKFPQRYFDVGIAEQHEVTFAAGLACEGLKPVAAIYSSFSQRCYDQIVHDVCLQKLPVTFALDRAGIVGEDGPTHHGVFDISLFRHVPNLSIIAPADENELQHALKTALDLKMPCIVRYPRGAGVGVELDRKLKTLSCGKGQWIEKGEDVNILAIGNRVHPSIEAAKILRERGISCGVINMIFAKPLDEKIIEKALSLSEKLVTVEDNSLVGGFGSGVLEFVSDKDLKHRVLRLGIPDSFIQHGKSGELYEDLELTAEGISKRIKKWLK
jgi:1-deoxy-D-xylulose-5-phosphate synthase